jgi:glycosyltransferase involved in cell wall biosynthesis
LKISKITAERSSTLERLLGHAAPLPPTKAYSAGRVCRDGKFLAVEGRPFRVKGVTYGTFAARDDGDLFPEPARLRDDLSAIAALGFNTVRTYTPPSADLLELASANGLRVIAGVHYADWREEGSPGRAAQARVRDAGRRAVEKAMHLCAGRREVLAVAVGNEVPADIVRLHGRGAVEEVLGTLVESVHQADPGMPATYCNYPTTEYLQAPGQDLVCFNVFLESPERFRAYLAHLQMVSGSLPLVLTELGLGSELHGEREQACALDWQLRAVDEAGCAGATLYSWTDDWVVAGSPVEGWGFGISDVHRRLKPAAEVAEQWARRNLQQLRTAWPSITVVVAAYNADRVIDGCLGSLAACRYPDLEVIVCDDGSTDTTRQRARRYPFDVLELQHGGLSVARNEGIAAARGEIVAFLDADARCHPEWPYYLAMAFEDEAVKGAGGPNLPLPEAGLVERAVALAPGNPVEVLISDTRAEHVPGCNMAFRRSALEAVGGFDPVYTAAGDDVDVCWKLLDRGDQIAFSPAAQVLHHRRPTVGAYLRQQVGYGKSERIVYHRHRHRFNRLGQARWSGFIYGYPQLLPWLLRPVVYHGPLGLGPFQGVVSRPGENLAAYLSALLPLGVPVAAVGLVLALLSPLWLAVPGLIAIATVLYFAGIALAIRPGAAESRPLALRLLVAGLFVVQPVARAWGRLRGDAPDPLPDHPPPSWSGDRASWLFEIERELIRRRCSVRSGGSDADWDLRASFGPLVQCRITTAVAWRWRPIHRCVYRPRMWVLPAVALPVGLIAAGHPMGVIALVLLAAAVTLETILLRARVRTVIARTTEGAR